MDAYPADGLNFVPMLAQSTPQCSSRSRLHSTRSVHASEVSVAQKTTVIFHHGNYEGDLSMFGKEEAGEHKLGRRIDLIETDSDTEYKRELDTYPTPRTTENQLLRLYMHYRDQLLTPARRAHLTTLSEELSASYYYQKSCELIVLGSALVVWLVRLALCSLQRVGNWSYGVCKSRVVLRNTARRLLWWMTLAKCGDATLFAMVLLGTPLLFVVAVLGFVLSVYCEFKDWLSRSGFRLC